MASRNSSARVLSPRFLIAGRSKIESGVEKVESRRNGIGSDHANGLTGRLILHSVYSPLSTLLSSDDRQVTPPNQRDSSIDCLEFARRLECVTRKG